MFRLIKSHYFHNVVKNQSLILTKIQCYGSTDLCSCGGPGQTNIQAGAECSGSIILILDTEHLSINIGVADIGGVKLELLEHSSGQEQTSAVGSSVVGQTNLDTVPESTGL